MAAGDKHPHGYDPYDKDHQSKDSIDELNDAFPNLNTETRISIVPGLPLPITQVFTEQGENEHTVEDNSDRFSF